MVFQGGLLVSTFPETVVILLLDQPVEPFLDHLLFSAKTDFRKGIKTPQDVCIPERITYLFPIRGVGSVLVHLVLEKTPQEDTAGLPGFLAILPGRRFGKGPEHHACHVMGKGL